jgi:hypothetical protein
VIYPGTTIHMECLWMRRFGTPKWNVSQEIRYDFKLTYSRKSKVNKLPNFLRISTNFPL